MENGERTLKRQKHAQRQGEIKVPGGVEEHCRQLGLTGGLAKYQRELGRHSCEGLGRKDYASVMFLPLQKTSLGTLLEPQSLSITASLLLSKYTSSTCYMIGPVQGPWEFTVSRTQYLPSWGLHSTGANRW